MFPTAIDNSYQPKNKRRPRNDLSNRDYICPCGKAYLSYPALFTHIKTKHNGRAPGQIIKPRTDNPGRRGRPRQIICDSESQTQDIAANALDRFCDFIMEFQKEGDTDLKKIYVNDPFYEIYITYNQQDQEPRYNQQQQLYEDSIDNILSQFLAQVNKRINQSFHTDITFVFAVMIAKSMNEYYKNQDFIKDELISKFVDFLNPFFVQCYPKFITDNKLQNQVVFNRQNMAKMLQLFTNWLTYKKYLNFKIRINHDFFKN